MTEPSGHAISITLSPAQVDQVLRAASSITAPGIAVLISGSLRRPASAGEQQGHAPPRDDEHAAPRTAGVACDPRLSRSLLRGLSILTCFGSPQEERGIVELAAEAGMSASTAHRYALTLIELGLLERSPRSRKYRLPSTPFS